MNFQDENIWIIGASSGIGESLAFELANQGARIILSARRENELFTLQQSLNSAYPNQHLVYPLDVSDSNKVFEVSKKIASEVGNIDRVLFMAAIYEPKAIDKMDLNFCKKLIEVNLFGAICVSQAMIAIFEKQGFGQIALCASSAGYLGLPNGQPYSASKAALINFAESLYLEVKKTIDIKLINPGFVATEMTAKNTFKMPMQISSEKAAKIIANGLRKKSFEIHFPQLFTFALKLISLLPYSIQLALTQKLKNYD